MTLLPTAAQHGKSVLIVVSSVFRIAAVSTHPASRLMNLGRADLESYLALANEAAARSAAFRVAVGLECSSVPEASGLAPATVAIDDAATVRVSAFATAPS